MNLVDKDDIILSRKGKKVTFFGKRLTKIAHEMGNFMIKENGIGLAAPQVGLPLRMFVMVDQSSIRSIINPEIIPLSDTMEWSKEGCLSMPGQIAMVLRYPKIQLKYQTTSGRHTSLILEGLTAFCAQHETDHCDGITMIDRENDVKEKYVLPVK